MAPLFVKSRRQVMRMKNKAVKNVTPSKFTICNSLQTEIVQQVEFNTVKHTWSFLVSKTECEVKNSVKSGQIVADKKTQLSSLDN